MMLYVFFIATALTGILGVPNSQTCELTMKKHGLTARFSRAASHCIHSLTLEDIQYYFKPNATENNKIPTLNNNISSPNVILPNAPFYGYDTSFKTVGMRYVDQVLSHMDNKDWYPTNYKPLDQLVHTLHMGETWTKAQKHYMTLQESGKNDARYVDVCKCVNDVDNNGVIKMLNFLALKIRYPGFSEGKRTRNTGGYENNVFSNNKNVGYNIGKNVGYNIGKNVGYNIGKNVGYNVGKNVGYNIGKNVGYNVGKNVGYNIGKNVGYNIGKNVGYNVGKSVGYNVGKKVGYNVGKNNNFSKSLAAFKFSNNLADNFKRANGVLVDGDPGLAMLDSQKAWAVWKKAVKGMVEQDYYEMAMFLYCRLNY